ncbi:MAG: OmpA family protein [Lentimicrobium sp.]|nr:OmpA family protein [Lentimicrobium sp.]
MPFAQSNYAGVSGLVLQPASIADSRYRFDMVFFGFNAAVSNNYLAIKREAYFNPSLWGTEGFREKYIFENLDGNDKSGLTAQSVFLPSFMINLSENSSIAFSSRVRGFFNVDNITEEFAKLAFEGFDFEPLLYKDLTNANLSYQGNYWTEFGLTYANVLLNSGKHFLKGGLTLKFLQRMASGYAYVSELNYRFDGSDTLSLFQSKVNFALSSNFDEEEFIPFKLTSDPGFGLDLGFVYEYRPNFKKYQYVMDGRENLMRPDRDKYLLRVGISLLDLGKVSYKKSIYSTDFIADVRNWDISNLEIDNLEELYDTITSRFEIIDDGETEYQMSLPTAMSIQIDYNFAPDFYLNFSPFIAFRKEKSIYSKNHNYSTLNLTPRYDRKNIGVSLPMQLDELNHFRAGIGLRLGFFWIGSNSLISSLFSDKIYSTDAYLMVKFPIFRSERRDDDHDGVSNKLDICPESAGIYQLQGCPDADGDGITDQKDECPYDPGIAALNGCPDRDGDGITDKNDRCPDHAGTPLHEGCPDSDEDGIVDFEDECPDQAGSATLRGCPDRDGDGIPDKTDLCPDIPGKTEFLGCPFADSDNDGIPDNEDDCPTLAGTIELRGCPDTDGDGISDKYDLCPETPGVVENKGCPPIQKEEIEIIDKAFSNLEFESGKSIIKSSSFSSLNELAELMVLRKMWKVVLSGHTDNTGSPDKNMELSKNRVQAVKDYLIKQGVMEFRIRAEWFGQEKPIADNKTAAGRQKNRRVEMKMIFE